MPQQPHRSAELERILELEGLLRRHELKEEQLRETLSHFHQLFETAPDVIYTLARDGSITSLNPAFEAATGWPAAEWLGRNFEMLIHPDDLPGARGALLDVLKGVPDLHVLRIRCRSGEFLTGEFTVRPLREGEAAVGWFGIVRDITKRVRAEEALVHREAEYRRLFEEAPVGIFRSSVEGRPLMANPALIKMLEYDSLEDLLLRDIEKEGYHPDTPRDEFQERIREAGELRGFETKWLKKDGSVLHVRESARAVRNGEGRIVGYEGTVEDISATVQAQDRLHQALEELQSLFRAMPDLYFRLKRDGTILDCLAGRAEDLYVPPDQFLGRRMQDVLPPAAGAIVEEALSDLAAGKEMATIEYTLPMAGKEQHFETRLLPMFQDQVMVIAHNITERKRAESALRESEERFRQVTEAALVGVYLVQNGKFRYVNPAFAEMFGYPVEEIEDRLASVDLTHPEDRGLVVRQVNARLSRALEAGRYVFRGLRKDGTVIHCEALSRFLDYHGRPAIIGTVMDITEQKRSEEALLRTSGRLQLQIDRMPIGCIFWDAEFKVVSWNPAAEQIFGFSAQEMLGRQPYDLIVPREVKPQVESIWSRLLQGDESAHSVNENTTHDGRTILCQWTNTPLKEPDGRTIGVLSMVEDITDRRRAEAALQESVGNLRRTLGTTITTMAKIVETKDPYTAGHQQKVAELAELIARELGLSPDRVQGLHMAAMIHDIGKIYIPAEILSKPGQLTRIELDMIRTHPNFGAEVLKTIPFPWPIADMILQHHERLDGSGYPQGLKGDAIMLESRILMVADVVEAMATHRPYRAARGLVQALQEIQDFRGRYYDPDVVDACLTVIRQGLFSIDSEGPPGRFT